MENLRQEKPKARKAHVCNFCSNTIQKGEYYNRGTNIFDGKIYTWKNHFACMSIAEKLNMWDFCDEGVTEDDFHEYIKQEYSNLISKNTNDQYQSDNFKGQLIFVLDFYNITHNII